MEQVSLERSSLSNIFYVISQQAQHSNSLMRDHEQENSFDFLPRNGTTAARISVFTNTMESANLENNYKPFLNHHLLLRYMPLLH